MGEGVTTTKRREYYLAEPERFWIRSNTDWATQEVHGEPVGIAELPEADLFLNQTICADNKYRWTVSCGVTGFTIAQRGAFTRSSAIRSCRYYIRRAYKVGITYSKAIQKAIDIYGITPRYAYYPEESEILEDAL